MVSLMAQMINNLLLMQETCVRSLGWEDSLEEGMATHSSILAWRITWTEEPGSKSMGSQRSCMVDQLTLLLFIPLKKINTEKKSPGISSYCVPCV